MIKSRLFAALFQMTATLLEYDAIAAESMYLRHLQEEATVTGTTVSIAGLPKIVSGTHIFKFMNEHVSRRVQQELGHIGYDVKGI